MRIDTGSQNIRIANNILWVDSGHDLFVDAGSQTGLTSDRNLFHQGTAAGAFVGHWGGTDVDSLADWQSTSGLDVDSYEGDPLFIDRDGADNIFGFDSTNGVDGGRDDNFVLQKDSPAIDRGFSWNVSQLDVQGSVRHDDPGTANEGSPRFTQTVATTNVFAPPVGIAKDWRGSQNRYTYTLPFAFPFYGESHTTAYVSTEGFLQFASSNAFDSSNTTAELLAFKRIAPLWDNLSTSETGNDIYIDESVADQVTIRWDATNTNDSTAANFAVVLFATGEIEFHYGDGNTGLSPTIGISAGNGVDYELTPYDGAAVLTNATPIRFDFELGFVDIGAYEFRGDSNDNLAPTVTGTGPSDVQAGTIIESTDSIRIDFSEEINQIDALAPAAYELRHSGANGIFGDGDDSVITLLPRFVFGDTSVSLNFVDGVLPAGNYRLTLYSDTAASQHDTAGIRLDGDDDGVAGGNYVRFFGRRDADR